MALRITDLCTDEIAELFARDYGVKPKRVERMITNTNGTVDFVNGAAPEQSIQFYRPDQKTLTEVIPNVEFGIPLYIGNVSAWMRFNAFTPQDHYQNFFILDNVAEIDGSDVNTTTDYVWNFQSDATLPDGEPWSTVKWDTPLRRGPFDFNPDNLGLAMYGPGGTFVTVTNAAGQVRLKITFNFNGFKMSFA